LIEIIGDKGTSEYSAAEAISSALEKFWPGLKNSSSNKELVRVAANVKISGYRVSDIDVVVTALFNKTRRFIPKKAIHDMNGKRVFRKPVTVKNIVLVIEVKDHDESGVKINGDNISVKYSRGNSIGWKSATDQNINQVHSLLHYIRDRGSDAYVHRCVIMRGLAQLNVNGAVGAGFDALDLLTSVVSVSKVRYSLDGYTLSSGTPSDITKFIDDPIFKRIRPTALNRHRMDLITRSTPESQELYKYMGKSMVRLYGHGGSGKTVMLLQMAWKAFDEKRFRTLVLTYNHALAADIRRLLALLKVPSNPEEGGIMVNTVMSFMYSWFHRLQFLEDEEDDFSYENYEKHCTTAFEMLKGGAITGDDVEEIMEKDPDRYYFDCIVVDEAQDWPQAEVDLLKKLYRPRNIALADGIDQLLRGDRPKWGIGVEATEKHLISLRRCLRMKRNLAVFTNIVAQYSGVKWEVKPNDQAGGGRVILLKQSYANYGWLHEELLEKAKESGNEELDFLFCVPPSDVVEVSGQRTSRLANYLSSSGYEVWNGVDDLSRKDFPRSKSQFRVVQYASCRGLEGWTVVLHQADLFWGICKKAKMSAGLSEEEELAYEEIEDLSSRDAWHKMLIALTRPIDTLVIDLSSIESEFSRTLIDIANNNQDFVQIVC
jgi:hypothetical protein